MTSLKRNNFCGWRRFGLPVRKCNEKRLIFIDEKRQIFVVLQNSLVVEGNPQSVGLKIFVFDLFVIGSFVFDNFLLLTDLDRRIPTFVVFSKTRRYVLCDPLNDLDYYGLFWFSHRT